MNSSNFSNGQWTRFTWKDKRRLLEVSRCCRVHVESCIRVHFKSYPRDAIVASKLVSLAVNLFGFFHFPWCSIKYLSFETFHENIHRRCVYDEINIPRPTTTRHCYTSLGLLYKDSRVIPHPFILIKNLRGVQD